MSKRTPPDVRQPNGIGAYDVLVGYVGALGHVLINRRY